MNRRTLIVLVPLALGAAFAAGSLLGGTAPAEAQQSTSDSSSGSGMRNDRMIAVSGNVGSGMSVLWLVDTESRRVLVYGTNNLGKNIELRAARNIEWDLRLNEYHDDSQWKADDLRKLAEKRREGLSPQDAGGESPGEERR